METVDQALLLLEAVEIQEKVHLESLGIVQEERSIQAKLATEECSIIELEKLMSVQLDEMYKLKLSIKTMNQRVHMKQTHQAQVEKSCRIYVEIWQQLHDSMTQISSNLNMALQEKDELTEVTSPQQQEINQLQERNHEQDLLHTKQVEQLHQLRNDVQKLPEAAREATEATDLKNDKKVKARLQKRWEVESQQTSARGSQLAGVGSKQLASSTAEVGTRTRVLQEINEELPVEWAEMTLLEEEVPAIQRIQVLESRWRVSVSELEQVRAHYMELKTALEGVERDEPGAECNLQLSEREIAALKHLLERLGAELVKLQTKKELLGSRLQQEWRSNILDLESHSSQVLKNNLQLNQQHLLTVQESLLVQQEECRKAEKNAKVNCQQISQLQTQEEEGGPHNPPGGGRRSAQPSGRGRRSAKLSRRGRKATAPGGYNF